MLKAYSGFLMCFTPKSLSVWLQSPEKLPQATSHSLPSENSRADSISIDGSYS